MVELEVRFLRLSCSRFGSGQFAIRSLPVCFWFCSLGLLEAYVSGILKLWG